MLKLRFAFLFCALAASAAAATSTTWEISGFNDFLKGRLLNLSLSSDGILQPGPAVQWNTALNQPAVWALAAASDGSLYAGTGHQGKVFHIARDGKMNLVFSAQQSEVFALCVDAKGIVYAGTSPSGGVYRIENGKATEIWHSPSKYVWGLALAPDGTLFVGAGEPGRVYHISTDGKSQTVFYDTGQANVTALAVTPSGHVLAGTDPNGILYDISAPGQAAILYDSALPEIRAIALDSAGNIYVAALGGAAATRGANATAAAASAPTAVVATTPTVVTVTEANEQSGVKVPVDQSKASGMATAAAATATPVAEVSGVEKSAIYLIKPDHSVQTLRSSKEDNVYDLLTDGDGVIFSTDDHGRIYSLGGSRTTLLAEPGDGETTRLVRAGGTLYAALSNPGRLLAFGAAGSAAGSYESAVHDATSVARWGHLQWHGMGTDILFRTRTGNSARPDGTWSAWSQPIREPAKASIESPVARFVQWRAEWPAGATAQISTVDLPFLPQNGPPAVHSITVTSVVGTNAQKTAPPAGSASASYSITVTDTGEAPAASSATSASQTVTRLQTTQTQISWQADDPDSDKLAYSVYFRAEDETGWQLIRSRMYENTLLLDADVFADGRYYFKVVASDSPANTAQYAREAELVSSPVLIDNTPPAVTLRNVKRAASTVDLDVEAADKTSPLRLCEFSVDAGYWQPVESTDGVTDAPQQRFHIHVENLKPGEHLLVVRVYDTANNAGLARVILR
jgi:WD40 repeat protein